MPAQTDSILELVLNSHLSNKRFFLSTQQEFEDFWSEIKQYEFELTRPVHTEERTLDPDKIETDCLEWLAGKENLLQISLRAKDIQGGIMTIEIMWVILHRIGKEKRTALRVGVIANLHIDRNRQHSAS
jgi:hypothetical protein